MKCTYLLLFLILSTKLSFGQNDTVYQYLNQYGKRCNQSGAVIARMAIKKDGAWLVRDYNAGGKNLRMSGSFSDDKFKIKQGDFYYYYNNGTLEQQGKYADGKRNGLWITYSRNGVVVDSSFFNNELPFLASYHWRNKHLVFKGIYDTLGNGSGEEWEYDIDGSIISYGKYSKGYVKDSIWQHYYKDATVMSKEFYKDGNLLKTEYYYRNGEISEAPIYRIAMIEHDRRIKSLPVAYLIQTEKEMDKPISVDQKTNRASTNWY